MAIGGAAAPLYAFTACTAAQISAGDANCPNNAALPCSIRSLVTLPAAATICTFDFGNRAVTIGSVGGNGGKIRLDSKIIVLKAGSLTIQPNGSIEGMGPDTMPPNDVGGMVTIETTGGVTLLSGGGAQGKIDVSGRTKGGQVTIVAGGTVSVGATIDAGQEANAANASGGSVGLSRASASRRRCSRSTCP